MTDDLSQPRPQLELRGGRDRLFEQQCYPHPFEFNTEVAAVFDDMVSRSIPLYQEVNHCLVEWAFVNLQAEDLVCDLGCSTGTTLSAIGRQLTIPLRLMGIDQSTAMLKQAEDKLLPLKKRHQVLLHRGDIAEYLPEHTALMIMNYTLQFIPVARRQEIVDKIYHQLKPGGIFFYSEKIRSETPEIQEVVTCSYEYFKRRQGYSPGEIERKKEALDQVLIPYSMKEHLRLLENAGFKAFEPILRWNPFVTFIAIKK